MTGQGVRQTRRGKAACISEDVPRDDWHIHQYLKGGWKGICVHLFQSRGMSGCSFNIFQPFRPLICSWRVISSRKGRWAVLGIKIEELMGSHTVSESGLPTASARKVPVNFREER